MRLVVMESPYAGNVHNNLKYAYKCLRACLLRGDAPLASHVIYTEPGVLNDVLPNERKLGMEAGWAWMEKVDAVVVYIDRGISNGMLQGMQHAMSLEKSIEIWSLDHGHLGNAFVGDLPQIENKSLNEIFTYFKESCVVDTKDTKFETIKGPTSLGLNEG